MNECMHVGTLRIYMYWESKDIMEAVEVYLNWHSMNTDLTDL